MSTLWLGVICGLVFGLLAVTVMIPLPFADKRAALLGAFVNRLAIGFAIGASALPLPGWLNGLLWGVLLSLPDAIITKSWAPIMGMGAVGGVLIGVVIAAWGR